MTKTLPAVLLLIAGAAARGQSRTFTTNQPPIPVGLEPTCVIAADVNGDGYVDLITADNGTNTLTILTNTGNGTFVFGTNITVGNGPACVVAADFNGDGKLDLACVNEFDDTLTVLTNAGQLNFVQIAVIPVGDLPYWLAVADFNGDGQPDLVCANSGTNTLTVLTNAGDALFIPSSTNTVGEWPFFVLAADVNNDGYPDLISANNFDDTVTILTNNGQGVFARASTSTVGSSPTSIAAVYFTGESRPDLKIDADVTGEAPTEVPGLARKAEEFGFDGLWAGETKHDPFVQVALASSATRSISLGTSVALAFTRSPTTIAQAAWDLQSASGGRFMLGLGTQVKGHIERRFGMKWEPPEPKMREVIQALRAVWRCWQTGQRLDFRGRFFRLDLMTPFFNPGPIPHPDIPIYVAGVNRRMFRLAGEVAEGLHVHPLHTVRYLREVMLPEVEKGLAASGRTRKEITVAAPVFAAVGDDESQVRAVREAYRSQIAFYASTRTYRAVMELHGWADVCDRLHELSVRGEWGRMSAEIGREILDEVVVEGAWSEIGRRVRERYGDAVDRVRLYLPFDGATRWRAVVEEFRA